MKNFSIRMKLTAVFITGLFASSAWALPPQAEADKLMIEAKAAMGAKDYDTAAKDFARVEELHVRVPDTFAYHYGVALSETGEFEEAKQQLDKYITKAGPKGKFYKEALEMYAKTEARQAEAEEEARQAEAEEEARQAAAEAEARQAEAEAARQAEEYNIALEDYKKKKIKYEEELREANDRYNKCYNQSISDNVECVHKVQKKHGGFFGNAVKAEKYSAACNEMFDPDRCGRILKEVKEPVAPTQPARQ